MAAGEGWHPAGEALTSITGQRACAPCRVPWAAAQESSRAKGRLRRYQTGSGFSVDAGVCIEAHDRAALEQLLRYCARPPFPWSAYARGSKLVYRCAKQRSEATSDKRGAKVDELHLTPLELIDRIAALVPPPRTHRHRCFGVLAPNSPLSGGNGAGSACCVATSHGGDCTTWRGRTWGGGAGQHGRC